MKRPEFFVLRLFQTPKKGKNTGHIGELCKKIFFFFGGGVPNYASIYIWRFYMAP